MGLADLGRRVVLFDADLALASVDTLLGLTAELNVADVISGKCTLDEVMLQGPGGIRIVPGTSGERDMAQLSSTQHAGLISVFSEIGDSLDVLVIDTGPGIGETVLSFVRAAREVLVVVCDEPSSINDAYMLIKLLSQDHGISRFHLLANMTRTPLEGPALFKKLLKLTDHFLCVVVHYLGEVPFDMSVRKAALKHRAVSDAYPKSKCALAYRDIAKSVDNWPLPADPSAYVEFFAERLIRAPRHLLRS
jgi:flagellar biosynthesis protein FlhG